MMIFISFVLNLPWTILAILFSLLSIPQKIILNSKPFAVIFKVKSFWWWTWLPGVKNTRGMALGNVVMLGPNELPKDLEHELVHIEQINRAPFIHPFLYEFENLRKGYQNNKYEREAYEKAGNLYIKRN